MQDKTVSAIVPVFNEEKTVAKVVKTLLASPLISEVICINDGSSDRSLEVLRGFGKKIKLVNFRKNRGKGSAVAAGIRLAKKECVLFCDSDLINFSLEHIQAMLAPILNGETRVVLAVPTQNKDGSFNRNEVYLAGERVYSRTALLPHLSKLGRSKGAGASEVYLNTLFPKREIKTVPLVGLIKPPKELKWSSPMALKQYLLSAISVLQEIGRIEINTLGDLKKLENLVQTDNFENLIFRVNEIKSKKLKNTLERYFLRYISYIRKLTPQR